MIDGDELIKRFWKESAELMERHREKDKERQAQGIVDCRILITRIQGTLKQEEFNKKK